MTITKASSRKNCREGCLLLMVTSILIQQAWLGLLLSSLMEDTITTTTVDRNQHVNHQSDDLRLSYPDDASIVSPRIGRNDHVQNYTKKSVSGRYLVVRHVQSGQGAGQFLAGLFASHLLGHEFQRTVCVSPEYSEFFQAFHYIQADCHVSILEAVLKQNPPSRNNTVTLNNYQSPPSDCLLKQLLGSRKEEDNILYYVGNTYPKWPIFPNSTTFDQFYRPTKALIDSLPFRRYPKIVVHLRLEDGILDVRPGLDNITLHTLGSQFPSNGSTYLVTNNVAWYHFFRKNYGWAHPPWNSVQHSALGAIQWGAQTTKQRQQRKEALVDLHSFSSNQPSQTLQMWSDWYTILKAEEVYHTLSEFSLSAIRWSHDHASGYTIQGVVYDKEDRLFNSSSASHPTLRLQPDYDPKSATIPLVDRNVSCVSDHDMSQSRVSVESSESDATKARKMDLAIRLYNRRRIQQPTPMSKSSQYLFDQLRQERAQHKGTSENSKQ